MKYFIATSLESINAINGMGLNSGTKDTVYWGRVIKHPTLNEWAVGVNDSDEACCLEHNPGETPYTEAEMIDAGWNLSNYVAEEVQI